MVATATAPELWTEVGTLDLIELLNILPSSIAHGSGDVDLQVQDAHLVTKDRGGSVAEIFFRTSGAKAPVFLKMP